MMADRANTGVFDFEYLNKRIKELGIDPVYKTYEEKPEITAGPCSECQEHKRECTGACMSGLCYTPYRPGSWPV